MERLIVEEKVESDHFLIAVWIQGQDIEGTKRRGGKGVKWNWTKEGRERFKEKMERWWEEAGREEELGWKELKEGILRILRERQGMDKGKGGRKGWWDEECREYKKIVKRELEGNLEGGGERREEGNDIGNARGIQQTV